MMVWQDDMSVGVDVLDNDHKTLIGIINQFEKSPSQRAAEIALVKLCNYLICHFNREDEICEFSAYDSPHTHKLDHALILNNLRKLTRLMSREIEKFNVDFIIDISNYLTEWATQHIIKEGDKIRTFFNGGFFDNIDACFQDRTAKYAFHHSMA